MTRRKDGRWVKSITIDGKRIFFYSKAETKRAAERDVNNQILKYNEEAKKGKLFKDVLDEWKGIKMGEVPITTWNKTYRASVNRLENAFKERIKNITPGDVDCLLKTLASKGYSKQTVSIHKVILNQVFDFALINKYVQQNFIPFMTLPANLPAEKRKMPIDEELEVIKNNYTGFDLLPYFLLYSGLRISEALALTDQDIDFEKKLIVVNKKIIHNGNKPELFFKTKSEAGTREVILLDRLAEKIPKFKGILFCNKNGEHLTKRQFNNRWSSWQKRHGLTVTAHQLRHGYATMLLEAGIDVKDAQDLMGHADIKMTFDIYAEIRSKRKEETRKKLESFDF